MIPPLIDDFILVHYHGNGHAVFRDRLLNIMLLQIHSMYKYATTHIITNLNNIKINHNKVALHYFPKMKGHWGDKLRAYGLLDKPAMYLDTDVLLVKPFQASHLETNCDFRVYRNFGQDNHCEYFNGFKHDWYNNGIVWIKNPSKRLMDELFALYNKLQDTNEEKATSTYIFQKEWVMPYTEGVNLPYESKKWAIEDHQSVHYFGKKFSNFIPDLKQRFPKLL